MIIGAADVRDGTVVIGATNTSDGTVIIGQQISVMDSGHWGSR